MEDVMRNDEWASINTNEPEPVEECRCAFCGCLCEPGIDLCDSWVCQRQQDEEDGIVDKLIGG
jgi:hypothetical protein